MSRYWEVKRQATIESDAFCRKDADTVLIDTQQEFSVAGLSKSRVIAHRQCAKRLWLQINRPQLQQVSAQAQRNFSMGHQVGEIACRQHPDGHMLPDDLSLALSETQALLSQTPVTMFEATFDFDGVLTRADVMQPGAAGWSMTEVKSSTSVKDYHLEDAAVQAWVIENAGVPLSRIELAHINNAFVYQGDGDYAGLLTYADITEQVRELQVEVVQWVKDAKTTLALKKAPSIKPGAHCTAPFECPFFAHCNTAPAEEYPVELLPKRQAGKLAAALRESGYGDLRDVPFDQIPDKAVLQRVHAATVSGNAFMDAVPQAELAKLAYPRYYLDFETINPAVPRWAQSRPYQQVPFQWSCHIEQADGCFIHEAFLADACADPRLGFIESLIAAVGNTGPVLVYNASFENGRMQEMAKDFPQYAKALLSIVERVVDLYPMARDHYYHRDQHGSWSIKAVLPTIAPELDYGNLAVGNGGMAMEAFYEILHPETTPERRQELREALLKYCERDTWAMVRVAHHFAGKASVPTV